MSRRLLVYNVRIQNEAAFFRIGLDLATIGERLRDLRDFAGLSQSQLAQMLGVSRNAISQWEAGTTHPSARRLSLLSRVLNVPVDDIFTTSSDHQNRTIEVAQRLFSRLAVEDVSIDVICAAAEITRSQFEIYFGSKEGLIYATLNALNANMPIEPPLDAAQAVRERLGAILMQLFIRDLSQLKLTAAVHAYSWRWSRVQERENDGVRSGISALLARELTVAGDRGELAKRDIDAAALLI